MVVGEPLTRFGHYKCQLFHVLTYVVSLSHSAMGVV